MVASNERNSAALSGSAQKIPEVETLPAKVPTDAHADQWDEIGLGPPRPTADPLGQNRTVSLRSRGVVDAMGVPAQSEPSRDRVRCASGRLPTCVVLRGVRNSDFVFQSRRLTSQTRAYTDPPPTVVRPEVWPAPVGR